MLVLFRKTGKLGCSFCGKKACDVEALVARGDGRICAACAKLCVSAMAPRSSIPEQPCVRAIPVELQVQKPRDVQAKDAPLKSDTVSLLERLNVAQTAMDANRDAVQCHVRELRHRKTSWAKIGDSLGISRQAAWQRFS